MLSFLTPLWLLGLGLVPVIRWLHRGGPHRRAVTVTRLALWRGAQMSRPTAGARQPPDPAWRRRALLAALLLIALSGPQLPEQRVRVTLWIDDSLSMLTREAQGTTRLAEGLARVRSQLADLSHAEVEVRTLADPWRSLGAPSDATVAALIAGAGHREPLAPPGALLHGDRQQWLLTDGADATPFAWPGDRRPDRVVQVGSVTRNVGLERLSARRSPDDPNAFDLLVKVTNGGMAGEDRALVVTTGKVEVARANVRLDAGASRLIEMSIPASTAVHATLQPGDALPEDDDITLDLAPLRRHRVAVDPGCPKALVAAVGAHPALAVAPSGAGDAEAALDCGTVGAMKAVPTIRVLADRTPFQPRGALLWSPAVAESRRVELDVDRLQVAAHLQARPGDSVLLAIGDEPVIVSRRGEGVRLETSLDFGTIAASRGAELPLLVNVMFENVLDRRLLDEIAVVDRGPHASRVAPLPNIATPIGVLTRKASRALDDDVRPVLLVALLALLWEIAALVRQGIRLGAPAPARSR